MAAVLISSRRVERGIMECERALSLNPSLASAHAMLGLAKYLLGQGEETESHVEEALRSLTDNLSLPLDVICGVAAIQMEEDHKAVEWLRRRSININPTLPGLIFTWGLHLESVWQGGRSPGGRSSRASRLIPTFATERVSTPAFSDHRRHLFVGERTIQALQATGLPQQSEY